MLAIEEFCLPKGNIYNLGNCTVRQELPSPIIRDEAGTATIIN
jgi:hypothetical protein